jgi:peptidyl-prolyl cis-trans isomerase C
MTASAEKPQEMSGLDQALQAMREDMSDAKRSSKYYDLFLNTTFCVPTFDPQELDGENTVEEGQILPLIIESEGNDYLMLFDSPERLTSWAGKEVKWVGVPGHLLAATTMPPLHMALNVGTEHAKQFFPDEIAWLREIVQRYNAEAEAEQQNNQ